MDPTKPNVSGRYRPVQGLLQAYAVFSGIRGFLNGAAPGQPLEELIKGEPSWVPLLFWSSLLLGGIVSIAGEIIQLTCPVVNQTVKQLSRYLVGQLVEGAGDFLIACNYGGYALGIIISPAVADARAYPFLAISLGFLFRWVQLFFERRRLTHKEIK